MFDKILHKLTKNNDICLFIYLILTSVPSPPVSSSSFSPTPVFRKGQAHHGQRLATAHQAAVRPAKSPPLKARRGNPGEGTRELLSEAGHRISQRELLLPLLAASQEDQGVTLCNTEDQKYKS